MKHQTITGANLLTLHLQIKPYPKKVSLSDDLSAHRLKLVCDCQSGIQNPEVSPKNISSLFRINSMSEIWHCLSMNRDGWTWTCGTYYLGCSQTILWPGATTTQPQVRLFIPTLYKGPRKDLYMVVRNLFLLLLNCHAWLCLLHS